MDLASGVEKTHRTSRATIGLAWEYIPPDVSPRGRRFRIRCRIANSAARSLGYCGRSSAFAARPLCNGGLGGDRAPTRPDSRESLIFLDQEPLPILALIRFPVQRAEQHGAPIVVGVLGSFLLGASEVPEGILAHHVLRLAIDFAPIARHASIAKSHGDNFLGMRFSQYRRTIRARVRLTVERRQLFPSTHPFLWGGENAPLRQQFTAATTGPGIFRSPASQRYIVDCCIPRRRAASDWESARRFSATRSWRGVMGAPYWLLRTPLSCRRLFHEDRRRTIQPRVPLRL